MGHGDRQSIHPRPFRGYTLDAAARLEAAHPHFLLRLLHGSSLTRQCFFMLAAEIDLRHPEAFLDRIAENAPDVLSDLAHLDAHSKIARAFILLKPRRLIQTVFGACPEGLPGLIARLGPDPVYPSKIYRQLFDLFSESRHRRRAKVLQQLAGPVQPDRITVVSQLDKVLVHPRVLERVRPREVEALNTFSQMIQDLCGATPAAINESLDALPVGATGSDLSDWVQGWIARQVRLHVEPPIPSSDPNFRLVIGGALRKLGHRFRNCAGQRQAHTLLAERLIYEWTSPGQSAVLELLRVTSGTETRWVCEDLLAVRNRRVSPEVAAAVQAKLSKHGVLYQSLTRLPADEQALHDLLDHNPNRPLWDEQFIADQEAIEDNDFARMLDELDRERLQEAS